MPKGIEIINLFGETVNNQDPGLWKKVQVQAANAQMQIHDLHARAIACHCECMGMATEGGYEAVEFDRAMQKWGLTDNDNNPII